MKIFVTGAKGFVGKNLCAELNNIKEKSLAVMAGIVIDAVYEYDIDSNPEELMFTVLTVTSSSILGV